MPLVILFAFEYKINHLPGAIIDLYHAHKWCQSFTSNIFVVTDITSLRIAIRDILTNIVNFDNKLIIYYTGHGVKDSLIMPDQSLFSFVMFRDSILNLLAPYVELFIILDCCHPLGLHLPYKLVDNRFVLASSKIECVSQPIILITSSDSHEKSTSTRDGSIFTRRLFHMLSVMNKAYTIVCKNNKIFLSAHQNRNLTRLSNSLATFIRKLDTGYAQTVSVYSSYVIDPVLWLWIGAIHKRDVVLDMSLSTFIIRETKNDESLVRDLSQDTVNIIYHDDE